MMMHRVSRWLLGVLMLGPSACEERAGEPGASGESGGSETGDGSSEESGEAATEGELACDHDRVDDCCCFYDELSYYVRVACEFEPLCDEIGIACPDGPDDCPAEDASVADEAALDCALEALGQGAVGLVSLRLSHSGDTGAIPVYETRDLYLRGDGTAFLATESVADSPAPHGGAQLVALAETATFESCAALPGVPDRLDCLLQAVTSELDVCLPPA